MTLRDRRRVMLAAITASGGRWTPRDVSAYARQTGGSEVTYETLDWLVRRGKVTYTPNVWTLPDND